LERKLGTFRHCGQLAAEYHFFVPIQVKIVSVISYNLDVCRDSERTDIFRRTPAHNACPLKSHHRNANLIPATKVRGAPA
jgi:hypothetical protein